MRSCAVGGYRVRGRSVGGEVVCLVTRNFGKKGKGSGGRGVGWNG